MPINKLKMHPYDKNFPKLFEKVKNNINKVIKDCEIHHIGSTAVPGLGGKGIIDIMIGIEYWKQAGDVIKKLKSIGFSHAHSKENERIFVSNKKQSKFADFHLHIVKNKSKEYKNLLFFKNYLIGRKKEIAKLYKLKLKWQKQSNDDWKLYGKLKSAYVNKILNKNTKTKSPKILKN